MKVLLDENLPHRLRHAFPGHEVITVAYMGWSGLKNGELLKLAEGSGFNVLLTADRNLAYQQNLQGRLIALVCLTALDWEIIKPHLEEIVSAVATAIPGCGVWGVSAVLTPYVSESSCWHASSTGGSRPSRRWALMR